MIPAISNFNPNNTGVCFSSGRNLLVKKAHALGLVGIENSSIGVLKTKLQNAAKSSGLPDIDSIDLKTLKKIQERKMQAEVPPSEGEIILQLPGSPQDDSLCARIGLDADAILDAAVRDLEEQVAKGYKGNEGPPVVSQDEYLAERYQAMLDGFNFV